MRKSRRNETYHRPAVAPRAAARLAALLLAGALTPAAYSANTVESLKQLSIESLMNVEVYSASRRLETTQSTASASYVLTSEDLARAAITSVPDALRLVPGVQVGRVDANKWAVGMRGFNSRESNKLLVLVDGRTVYDALFSGTLWEAQDFMIEDIDRIEVIRGPGGTLWGANAFNGVINIVSRRAADTQGLLVSAATGTEDPYIAAARYGWRTGEDQHARVYVKGYSRDAGHAYPVPAHDESGAKRAGFRWDRGGGGDDSTGNTWTVSGDTYEADTDVRESVNQVQYVEHRGRNVLARWTRRFDAQRALQVRVFYDHVDYDSIAYDQERDTWDVDVQHRTVIGSRHRVVWGGGLRSVSDETATMFPGIVDVLPAARSDELVNVFAQDTIALLPDRLSLIAGLKYEKTEYAESDWLPNLRLAWTPNPDRTLWAAVSEATRMPSRIESDLTFFGTIRIGARFGPEHVRNHELGLRQLVREDLWFDLVLFHSDYSDLRTGDAGGMIGNGMYGRGRGAELAVRWKASEPLRIDAAYTFLDFDFALEPGRGTNFLRLRTEGLAPRHQASLRAALDLPRDARLDATLRHVGRLSGLGVPSYTEFDLALSYRLGRALELSLVGRNLLHDHHPEQGFASSATGLSSEVRRSALARLTWTP